MSGAIHHYATNLAWSGSTGLGYNDYGRSHRISADPANQVLDLTSDPAFLGDPALLNPEQLLIAAASSCQLLSFLAIAAKSRIDVVSYTDSATAVMDEFDQPARINSIQLSPAITLADSDRPRLADERLKRLVDLAHRSCYIANSLRTEVRVSPVFRWQS